MSGALFMCVFVRAHKICNVEGITRNKHFFVLFFVIVMWMNQIYEKKVLGKKRMISQE